MNTYSYSRQWLLDLYGLLFKYGVLWSCDIAQDNVHGRFLFNFPLGGYPVVDTPLPVFEEQLRNGGAQFLPPILYASGQDASHPSPHAFLRQIPSVVGCGLGVDGYLGTLTSSRRSDVRRALKKCVGLDLNFRLPSDEELQHSLRSVQKKFPEDEWASTLLLSGYAIAKEAVSRNRMCSVVLTLNGEYAGCMFLKDDGGYLSGVAYQFNEVCGIGTAALALYAGELPAGTTFLPGVGLNELSDNDTSFTRYMVPVCNDLIYLHGYAICKAEDKPLPPYCLLPDRIWQLSG